MGQLIAQLELAERSLRAGGPVVGKGGRVEKRRESEVGCTAHTGSILGGSRKSPKVLQSAVACSETDGGSGNKGPQKIDVPGYVLLVSRCGGAIGHDAELVMQRTMGVPVHKGAGNFSFSLWGFFFWLAAQL